MRDPNSSWTIAGTEEHLNAFVQLSDSPEPTSTQNYSWPFPCSPSLYCGGHDPFSPRLPYHLAGFHLWKTLWKLDSKEFRENPRSTSPSPAPAFGGFSGSSYISFMVPPSSRQAHHDSSSAQVISTL